MHTHYRTKAFFLKKEDRAEADQLFTLFTKDFGKIKVLAKGIRKITSKLRSASDLFFLSEIEFIQGKTYKTLTDAVLIEKFLKNDFLLKQKIAEILDFFLKQEKDDRVWKLLSGTLSKLDSSNCADLLYYNFLWNFFSFLGYTPELYNCVSCQKKLLPETLFFSPEQGGVLCWRCFQKESKEISVGTVQALRLFLDRKDVVEKLRVCQEDKNCLQSISDFYHFFLKNTLNPQPTLDN